MSLPRLQNFRHDICLMRQLRAYELRHFLILLDYACDRRDPTFIPARKREEVRLVLGFGSGEKGIQHFEARLQRFHDLELIEIGPDGGILMCYLIDQEDANGDDEDGPASARVPSPTGPNNTPAGERRSSSERRQNKRPPSNSEAAIRKRGYRQRKREQGEGPAVADEQEWDTFEQNVPLFESECPKNDTQLTAEMSQEMSPNDADVPRVRVRDVSNVSGGSKESILSGDVLNVSGENVPPNVPAANVPQNVPPSNVPGALTAPRLRPALSEQQVPAARDADVRRMMLAVKEHPDYKGMWIRMWRHCHKHDLLHCWDEAVAMYAWRLKVSPPTGPGSIVLPPRWMKITLMALLDKAGAPYLTLADEEAQAKAQGPVDAAEAAEIREQALALKAQWDAENADAESAEDGGTEPGTEAQGGPSTRITSLDAIYPETEDE